MLYVITAVHNRYKITEKFVDNLLKETYKEIKLILVDDASTDGTADMVKSKMKEAIIIQGDGNLWWGGAMHEGYKWLKKNAKLEDYVMFANDDTEFDDDYIEKAITLLKKEPDILLTGNGINIRDGKIADGVMHWNFKHADENKDYLPSDIGNCASTRSLFLTVKTLLKVGGFHPILLPHYYSDCEWAIRAARKGIQIKAYEELSYRFDVGTTGDNDIETVSLKKMFSKRSVMNPFYRLNFIFLSTPIRYLPSSLFHQFKRYFGKKEKIKEVAKK